MTAVAMMHKTSKSEGEGVSRSERRLLHMIEKGIVEVASEIERLPANSGCARSSVMIYI